MNRQSDDWSMNERIIQENNAGLLTALSTELVD